MKHFLPVTVTKIVLLLSINLVSAQTKTPAPVKQNELKEGYYLIVGVFSSEENAQRYGKELGTKGFPTTYAFSPVKNMFYCFTMRSDSLLSVKDKYYELRKHEEFYSVWVLKVHDHKETKLTEISEEPKASPVLASNSKITSAHHTTHATNHHVKHTSSKGVRDLSHTHHSYKMLIIVKDEMDREVPALVQLVSGPEKRVIANIKNNNESHIHIPKKEDKLISLVCEAFGYHKTEISLPVGDPIALSALSNVKLDGDRLMVDLTLKKVERGDLMVMFNVFFHPNSNIMRMKSETDLQTLLKIMNENPSLKIMVHGHTNGNSSGEIIKIPDDCDNFFAPSQTEHTKGSSMKLSLLRAEAIKLFLMKNGITPDRVEVKGWGGKKMLYKEDSPNYQMNVRVEIEVLDI